MGDLSAFEHSQMPLSSPGSLSSRQYADITAFILQKNGFAAGSTPLLEAAEASRLMQPSRAARDLQRRISGNAPRAGQVVAAARFVPGPVKQPASLGPTQAELEAAHSATDSWPFFNKGLMGYRYSTLARINRTNAKEVRAVCVFQAGEVGSFQTGPVLYDGIGYVTTTHGTYAFDATTCRQIWSYQYVPAGPEVTNNNKGAAIAGGRVIRGTQDGHLFALDAKTGVLLWERRIMDSALGEFVTAAPIVWNDLVFVGKAGGDWGIVGEMMALRAGRRQQGLGLHHDPHGDGARGRHLAERRRHKDGWRRDLGELQPRPADGHAVRAGRQSRPRLQPRACGPATTCIPTPSSPWMGAPAA